MVNKSPAFDRERRSANKNKQGDGDVLEGADIVKFKNLSA
jgi:hypothetical protein